MLCGRESYSFLSYGLQLSLPRAFPPPSRAQGLTPSPLRYITLLEPQHQKWQAQVPMNNHKLKCSRI